MSETAPNDSAPPNETAPPDDSPAQDQAPAAEPVRISGAARFGRAVMRATLSIWLWVGIALFAFIAIKYWQFHIKPVADVVHAFQDDLYALNTSRYEGPLSCNDFRHIYLGAQMLRDGRNPYDLPSLFAAAEPYRRERIFNSYPNPYVYPAFTGWAMQFIAEMPYDQAAVRWFYDNHLMILLAALAAAYGFRRTGAGAAFLFFLAVAACYVPLWRNDSAGQLNVPLLLAYALIWVAIERRQSALAGSMAAAAAWFKLSPGILILYFLLTRKWREAIWMTVIGIAIGLAMWRWTGTPIQRAFLDTVSDMRYGHSTGAEVNHHFYADPANQSFNSFFHHMLSTPPTSTKPWIDVGSAGPTLANAATWAVSLALMGIVAAIGWRPRANGDDAQDEYESLRYSLFIFLSLMLPSLCWDHYFTQLLFPMTAIFSALRRRFAWVTGACFAAAIYVLSKHYVYAQDGNFEGAGLLRMSMKLWPALLLFAVTARLAYRARRESGAAPRATML